MVMNYCGESHLVRYCPLYVKLCKKYNNIFSVCLSSERDNTSLRPSTPHGRARSQSSRPSLHEKHFEEDEDPGKIIEILVIETMGSESSQSEIYVTVCVR